MIQQATSLEKELLRFHLQPNSSISASKNAFSVYGILIIPILIGGFLMHYVFQLYGTYLIICFIMLLMALGNIFYYYRRQTHQSKTLKLIIQYDWIQLLDQNQLYFQKDLHQMQLEPILCGKLRTPALKISSEDFEGIIIGLKHIDVDFPVNAQNKLSQPDYWILNKSEAQQLVNFMKMQIAVPL